MKPLDVGRVVRDSFIGMSIQANQQSLCEAVKYQSAEGEVQSSLSIQLL